MSSHTIFSGLKICLPGTIVEDSDVIIEKNKIVAIQKSSLSAANKLVFPRQYYLVPGFIDLHVHGAKGCDVMDGSIDALHTISQTLAVEGTTAFLATTMTASPESIEKVLSVVKTAAEKNNAGAEIIGIHLEGPFISPQKVGAQSLQHLQQPDVELFKRWQTLSGQLIKLVTLAPELKNSETFIRYLTEQNIVASIGHTNATYAETQYAIQCGCHYATHLFNAMRGMQQREPGTVGAILESNNVTAELILDEFHIHPAMVRLALHSKGLANLLLVTDSMRGKCLPDGDYELGGQTVHVKQHAARLSDGTLAGSVLTMPVAIRNFMQQTQCHLLDVLKLVSENPAKKMGIFDRKGSIAIHKDADLVILDDQLNVVMTVCKGAVVYQHSHRVVNVP